MVLYTASQEGKDTLGVCREEWVSTLHLLIFRRTAGRGGASVNSEVRAETVFKGAKEFSRSAEIAWSAVARELSSGWEIRFPKVGTLSKRTASNPDVSAPAVSRIM